MVSIIHPGSTGQYWSRQSAPLPYQQRDNGASDNKGSEREEAAVCCCTDRVCLHRQTFTGTWRSSKSAAVIWQRSTLPLSSPSENTPSCLFSCCLVVDRDIKVNHAKSSSPLSSAARTVYQMLSASFLAWKTHNMACR